MTCEPWPLSPICLPQGWTVDPAGWSERQRYAVEAAFSWLSRLSGNVFGLCTVTLRPCRRMKCQDQYPYFNWFGVPLNSSPWIPVMRDGVPYNITCGCGYRSTCGCGPICEVTLDGPVYDILQVKVDGAVIDPATYWVDDYRKLVRASGYDCWPDCQDLDKPDTEKSTWSVTYRRGTLPGPMGEIALTLLAAETDKLFNCDKTCQLPKGATRVTREGVSYEVEIPTGRTGIRLVDQWLDAVNPYHARNTMGVYSPDTVRGRYKTSPVPGQIPQPPGPFVPAYEWHQVDPQATWTISHPLSFIPAGVRIMDPTGQEMYGQIKYPSASVVQIEFVTPRAGVAYLS